MKSRRRRGLRTAALAMASGPALLIASAVCRADLSTCDDLYVGRIWVQQGYGLRAVVFLNSPTDTSGSLWSYFDNFSIDERKSALALLTSAKLAQHRVNVVTTDANGCDIATSGTYVSSLYLATNP